MVSPYAVTHEGEEIFSLPPEELWPELTDAARFERWWSWLSDLRLDPDEVATGTVMTFRIVTPLPYSMRCRVEFTNVVPAEQIETTVTGDLEGWANLEVWPHEKGSSVILSWELEPTQRPFRLLMRAARPVIMRTKDWAIDIALRSFRRNVEGG